MPIPSAEKRNQRKQGGSGGGFYRGEDYSSAKKNSWQKGGKPTA